MYEPQVAGGECCAEVVLNAFRKFSDRNLFGYRNASDSSEFTYVKYSEVEKYPYVLCESDCDG